MSSEHMTKKWAERLPKFGTYTLWIGESPLGKRCILVPFFGYKCNKPGLPSPYNVAKKWTGKFLAI